MHLKVAGDDDLAAVVALLESQFREHDIHLPADKLSDAARGIVTDRRRGAILLARDPDPVGVAVVAYTWTLEHGGRSAWLDELFVIPERRGQGIGRRLLREALEIARGDGCRAVDLEVEEDHARAERLYQREGFAARSRRRWVRELL